tara:strand:+ start:2065 stop:4908 length:2844 start_codon:yes stop_codon:yes gene_type:complete
MGRSISGDTASNSSRSVLSVDGFQTGDLIYETTGKVGPIPDTFAGSTAFSATANLSNARSNSTSLYSTKLAVPTDSEKVRCFGSGEPTAVLSDGNVVTAYFGQDINSSNSTVYLDVYFRIDQPDGTPVVAETQINIDNSNYENREGKLLSVHANSAGGFIVAFHAGSTNYLSWKIFTNAGVEQGNQQIKTTWTNIKNIKTSSFGITNEFAIGINDSSNNLSLVRVNASGEQQTISVGNTQYGTTFDMCSTSYSGTGDLVHLMFTVSNYIQRKSYNSVGTNLINESIQQSQGGNTIFDVSCDSSSTDSICVVWTQNGQETINTIGVLDGTTSGNWTERIWLGNFDGASQGASDAGNFVGNISGTNNFLYTVHGYYEILTQVIAYNGTVVNSFIRNLISQSWQGAKGLIKAGTELRYYATSGTTATPDFTTFGARLSPLQYVVLNPTTYLPSGENSDLIIVDTAQVASSGYVKNSATPTSAKFYAAANSSVVGELPRTTNTASLVQPMTSLGIAQAAYIKALELDNGNIAILYSISAVIRLKIIDKDYNSVSLTTISSTNSGNGEYKFDIKRLTNNNIIICFPSPDNYTIINGRVYDPTMTTIVTADEVITDVGNSDSDEAAVSLTPIPYSDTKFVFTYKVSSRYYHKVMESTDLSQVHNRVIGRDVTPIASSQCQTVIDRQGYFYLNYTATSGGTQFVRAILNTSTFALETFVTMKFGGSTSYTRRNSETCLLSDGTVMAPYVETSGQDGVRQLNGTSTSDDNERNVSNGRNDQYGAIQGVTGDGQWFMYNNKNTTNGGSLWLSQQEGGNPSFYSFGSYSNGLTTGAVTGDVGCTTPSSGSTAHIIAYSTVSQFYIAKVRIRTESYILATTSGVTESLPVSLNGNNAPLIGVAAQDCAAGEVGLVQTKGSASLNTNYPSSTSESFDFRTQTADGVKGFISGRNISLGD